MSSRTVVITAFSRIWTRSTPASEITTSPATHDAGPKKPVEKVDQRDLRERLAFAAGGQRVAHDQSRVAKE